MAATVTIASHARVYSDSTVAVTGASLTTYRDGSAIADGDTLYVYYDDPDRQGGAVTFLATSTSGNAVCSSDNPARHYVGTITVPTSGSSSSGTSASPGGTGGAQVYRIGSGFK